MNELVCPNCHSHLLHTDALDVLTVAEVARRLKFSDRHVRRLATNGEIPAVRLGAEWRFSERALVRHLGGAV